MLYHKITRLIEDYLLSDSHHMLLIDEARQIGKSYIIRWVGQSIRARDSRYAEYMIPSTLENKKKRIIIKDIENKSWKRASDYVEKFD